MIVMCTRLFFFPFSVSRILCSVCIMHNVVSLVGDKRKVRGGLNFNLHSVSALNMQKFPTLPLMKTLLSLH